MPKSLSSRKSIAARRPTSPQPHVALARGRRRILPLMVVGAALAVVAAGVAGWWHRSAAPAAAPSTATALQPTEARLLATARREPANPQPYLNLADEYAGSKRPASALWAYTEAEARAPGDDGIHLKTAAALRQLGYPASAE